MQMPGRIFQDLTRNPYDMAAKSLPADIQAKRSRFWEIASFIAFLHEVFPHIVQAKSPGEAAFSSWWYFLKVRLMDNGSLFVLRNGKQILGTAFIKRLQDTQTGFISHVGIHPNHRRQGFGKAMMRDLILSEAARLELKRLVLNVNAHDRHVRYLYESLGFRYYQGNAFDIEVPEGELPMLMDLE